MEQMVLGLLTPSRTIKEDHGSPMGPGCSPCPPMAAVGCSQLMTPTVVLGLSLQREQGWLLLLPLTDELKVLGSGFLQHSEIMDLAGSASGADGEAVALCECFMGLGEALWPDILLLQLPAFPWCRQGCGDVLPLRPCPSGSARIRAHATGRGPRWR